MEGLAVDGDGEGGLVLVVDANDGAPQPHAAPPHAPHHLVPAGVVRKEASGFVQNKPTILPALHDVGPLGQGALHVDGVDGVDVGCEGAELLLLLFGLKF